MIHFLGTVYYVVIRERSKAGPRQDPFTPEENGDHKNAHLEDGRLILCGLLLIWYVL